MNNTNSKEELSNMIVPVYGLLNGLNTSIGTAFILKNGLVVTSAHIFYNSSGVRNNIDHGISVKGRNYPFSDPIFEEFPRASQYSNTDNEEYIDLSVFHLPVGLEIRSELVLSFTYNERLYIKGYPCSNDTLNTTFCEIDILEYSYKTFSNEPFIRLKFSNCFRILQFAGDGSSGGPVLSGNRVVGMVVYGHPESGTTALKSEYIQGKLSSLNMI
jgi:hypothetical protein